MPLIYTNRGFTLIFALAFLTWVASELLGPARRQGSAAAARRDRGSTAVLAATAGLGVLLFFTFPIFAPGTTMVPQLPFIGVGITLACAGTVLRWWAIRVLGASFTGSVVLEASQRLITHGPYRRVRHPAYTGILLVVAGFGFMMSNWASILSISAGMFVGLLYRISIEESALSRHFGLEYREYMQSTKRLVPFLF